jgi:hypothetical protein
LPLLQAGRDGALRTAIDVAASVEAAAARRGLHRLAAVLVLASDVRTSRDLLDGSANAVSSDEVGIVEGVFESLGGGGVGRAAVEVGVLGDGHFGLA